DRPIPHRLNLVKRNRSIIKSRNLVREEPPPGSYESDGTLIPDADGGVERLRRRPGSILNLKKLDYHWPVPDVIPPKHR
ncbi:MAG: hypothetical protein GY757_17680, partial [bacterium]|nr:hypothetical protein [bacterium]